MYAYKHETNRGSFNNAGMITGIVFAFYTVFDAIYFISALVVFVIICLTNRRPNLAHI